ncbi:hypothetical protein [Mesorhizobium xinjiangense]|uniref:hypothetical protein n=1 Tax=Mesorhizobium xinjiangense TaxID=2678685 RepID=UPI0012ECD649|nr:hypothetical protein [Mesorhizobium xinjiangense]
MVNMSRREEYLADTIAIRILRKMRQRQRGANRAIGRLSAVSIGRMVDDGRAAATISVAASKRRMTGRQAKPFVSQ